jgi:2-keto-4-pentenoate hydratase
LFLQPFVVLRELNMTIDISHAVRVLVEARRSGTQVAPPFDLPDRSAVYAIQDGVAAATGLIAGWKVGARTPTAEPNPAPLLAGALVPSPASFDGKAMHMIGVEIEISFHIARDIAARDTPVGYDEALSAVGDAFVGMEVVDTRLANFQQLDPEWLLADNQMNHGLVVGDAIPNWKGLDWANLQVRLEIDGQTIVDQKGGARLRRSGEAIGLDDRPRGAPARRPSRGTGDHDRFMDRLTLFPAGHSCPRYLCGTGFCRGALLTLRQRP